MKSIYPAGAALMAPIADHTDMPTRLSMRRHGCRFAFTQMIDAGSLVFSPGRGQRMLARADSEDFLGVQLVGSDLSQLSRAAEIINSCNFDILDFNLGCPAPKVAKKGEGIRLALERPDDALRCVETLVKTSRIPVSVKTRIQSETDIDATVSFCRRLESAGISALTLHGRVMKVFYSGPVFYDIIKAVRESVSVQVIANGGALSRESYLELLERSGCSCGMIARGALGNPWIFREIGVTPCAAPCVDEFANELERHISEMAEFYGEEQGFKIARKTILEYLRGRGFPSSLRASASFISSYSDFGVLLNEVRKGPSWRYWEYLSLHGDTAERRLSKP